ncbi:MAG: YdjY domain-containing protein [Bythopirellula sp.]|nr:YdjY domain-containing protein [Bythopirellula sp.]
MLKKPVLLLVCLISTLLLPVQRSWGEEAPATVTQEAKDELSDQQAISAYFDPKTGEPRPPKIPAPEGAKALPKPDVVWVDTMNKLIYVDGYVSLREGMLEMLACTVGTKEHESVVAVFSRAQTLHAALLALGAEVGHPASFRPKFRPPAGTEIEIEIRWQDKDGKWQSATGQDLVMDIRKQKPMTYPWVFAGSGFWQDEETGKEFYKAEAGDLICVSNFSTAMLDIPVESSQVNDGLMFEANTEKIPRLGTPVRVVLKPKLKKE